MATRAWNEHKNITRTSAGTPYTAGCARARRSSAGAGLIFRSAQFLCHSDNCEVLVRFDDQQPLRFRGVEPARITRPTTFSYQRMTWFAASSGHSLPKLSHGFRLETTENDVAY